MPEYSHTHDYPVPVEALFEYHQRKGALARLTPPWEKVKVVQEAESLEDGNEVKLETEIGPFNTSWNIQHFDYKQNSQFCDQLIKGPFKKWIHKHKFESSGNNQSRLTDHIAYDLPFGGNLFTNFVTKKLERLFKYRNEIIEKDLVTHKLPQTPTPMRILVTGATGLIGRALVPFLRLQGHTVLPLSRYLRDDCIWWDPYKKDIDPEAFRDTDAVIHLAGESVFQGRWTRERKRGILESRFLTTHFLVDCMTKAAKKPNVFICASGTGYYGSQIDFTADETAPAGRDFLAYVCKSWEKAASRAKEQGIRVINLRTGLVLSPAGGILSKLLPLFKLGLGGSLGNGNQMLSWITIDDVLGIIQYCLAENSISGPVNVVAPKSTTNKDFAQTLANVLGRPCIVKVPSLMAQIVMGKRMATETVLSDIDCVPHKILNAGYNFRYPELSEAVGYLCGTIT